MSEPGRGLVLFSACVWTAWLPLLTVCAASLSTSKFVGSCASDSCVMTNEVHSYAVIDVKSRYGVSGIGSSDEATPFNRGDPAADRFHWACLGAVLAFVLACSGCATEAGLSTSDVESVAKGDSVTLLVLGTGNQWAPRTEPDLYMVVQAQHPTPAEKVQTDLSECQVGARKVWNSDRTQIDRTILLSRGPVYNPSAQVSKATMELLARTYGDCLSPKGYMVSVPDQKK